MQQVLPGMDETRRVQSSEGNQASKALPRGVHGLTLTTLLSLLFLSQGFR